MIWLANRNPIILKIYAYFNFLNLRPNALDGFWLGQLVIIGGHGFDPPVVLVGYLVKDGRLHQ